LHMWLVCFRSPYTVIAVNIILSKSCCTIFVTCMVFVSSPSNISAEYKNVCTSVITRNTNIGYILEQNTTANIGLTTSLSNA